MEPSKLAAEAAVLILLITVCGCHTTPASRNQSINPVTIPQRTALATQPYAAEKPGKNDLIQQASHQVDETKNPDRPALEPPTQDGEPLSDTPTAEAEVRSNNDVNTTDDFDTNSSYNEFQFEQNGIATLNEIEQLAIANNPAIQQMYSEIDALRGKRWQAGLSPNPTVGINGGDINEGGGGGRYGVYFGREVVKGGKLEWSQAVVTAEIETASQRLNIVRQKLISDVDQRYYDLLVAQEKVIVSTELVELARKAVDVSEKLLEAQEVAKTALFQSELEYQNSIVVQRQAENERLAARRKLAALLGETELPLVQMAGNPREMMELDDFEFSYDQLINSSPEISALLADVTRARQNLSRQQVEAIPNVTWQTSLQFDTVTDDIVGGFQVGMPLPVRNCNQGAIAQAQQEIIAAQHVVEKRILDLRQRLAGAFESYLDAKLQLDAYDAEIIPKAKQTYELISEGYRQGEVDFLQLLTAQRTYSRINLEYLDRLRDAWRQQVAIKGLLLTGSLN